MHGLLPGNHGKFVLKIFMPVLILLLIIVQLFGFMYYGKLTIILDIVKIKRISRIMIKKCLIMILEHIFFLQFKIHVRIQFYRPRMKNFKNLRLHFDLHLDKCCGNYAEMIYIFGFKFHVYYFIVLKGTLTDRF